ncbi:MULTISPECIES: hypothetical protein [unclassified Bradyrhizobium]|uniref:hypothetical protein n=1 Tax=unclassified Bradyrhizobium TaxID=2631580 RepID=UPI001FFC05BD|nr:MULTISPECIES: hypothetical protein [unclassified Bradyrhizobium]
MLELFAYLRASGFRTFIVSAGGIDFMHVFAERVYGVPPERATPLSFRRHTQRPDSMLADTSSVSQLSQVIPQAAVPAFHLSALAAFIAVLISRLQQSR